MILTGEETFKKCNLTDKQKKELIEKRKIKTDKHIVSCLDFNRFYVIERYQIELYIDHLNTETQHSFSRRKFTKKGSIEELLPVAKKYAERLQAKTTTKRSVKIVSVSIFESETCETIQEYYI